MGNSYNKKKLGTVTIEKGIVQDNFGKQYDIDFVGDNDDFVNISYASDKKKNPSTIKTLLSQNKNLIYDICFINNYSYLLVGCDKGYIYVYQRKNNGKANLLFDELCKFKPHNDSILQIKKLISGHILTLCGDSSAKILKIEIDLNGILYENKKICEVVQTLLNEGEYSENSAIELINGNLIISQGFFINFFKKKGNSESIDDDIEFQLTKKIFTNSDNIFFTEIDYKTIVASQMVNSALDFYDLNDYSMTKRIEKIEFGNRINIMCLINKQTLAIGGNKGAIYLVDTIRKQLFYMTHIDNFGKITCLKSIDSENIIISCFDAKNKSNDVIVYKIGIDNNFEEVKRKNKVHDDKINDIKLITMSISKNKNNFVNNYNVITIGNEHKIKIVLNDDE
jgi:hypothetical protein